MHDHIESILDELRRELEDLKRLNRTVEHTLVVASSRSVIEELSSAGVTSRWIPAHRGHRWDSFRWDEWDDRSDGAEDLVRFLEVARRVGARVARIGVRGLIPEVSKVLADGGDPCDYWLYVVHHLSWEMEVRWGCRIMWFQGETLDDERFALSSVLPTNVVQASCDALEALIDAVPRARNGSVRRVDGGHRLRGPHATSGNGSVPVMVWAEPSPEPTDNRRNGRARRTSRNGRRPIPKRAIRAANIEKIREQLQLQIELAREYAQNTLDDNGLPELLPRPLKKQLAVLAGCSQSDVTRCFKDSAELRKLWNDADNADFVFRSLKHRPARKKTPEQKDGDFWDAQMAHDRRR